MVALTLSNSSSKNFSTTAVSLSCPPVKFSLTNTIVPTWPTWPPPLLHPCGPAVSS
ncbi:unnamed protein product [Tenebrio molitor]|nr:unnamed protein product [Tenebrio molitor]